MIHVENLIDGQFVNVEENFDDISPLDFSVIATIPRTKNVDAAVTAAKNAFGGWSSLTLHQRCDWLDKVADELEKLLKLKESGVLSEEEFLFQKKKILS